MNENTRNLNGDTPLIAIVSRPVDKKGSKYACLGALLKLAHSLEINATTAFDDNTALHIAVKVRGGEGRGGGAAAETVLLRYVMDAIIEGQ